MLHWCCLMGIAFWSRGVALWSRGSVKNFITIMIFHVINQYNLKCSVGRTLYSIRSRIILSIGVRTTLHSAILDSVDLH